MEFLTLFGILKHLFFINQKGLVRNMVRDRVRVRVRGRGGVGGVPSKSCASSSCVVGKLARLADRR